jgi:hypothetical protein
VLIREASFVGWRRVLATVGYIHVAGIDGVKFCDHPYVSSLQVGDPIGTKSHGKSFARGVVGPVPGGSLSAAEGPQTPGLTSLVASTRSVVLFCGSWVDPAVDHQVSPTGRLGDHTDENVLLNGRKFQLPRDHS